MLVTAAESQKLDSLKQPYVYEILICVKFWDFLILDSPLWKEGLWISQCVFSKYVDLEMSLNLNSIDLNTVDVSELQLASAKVGTFFFLFIRPTGWICINPVLVCWEIGRYFYGFCYGFLYSGSLASPVTLPKTSIFAREKWWLEDEMSFWEGPTI